MVGEGKPLSDSFDARPASVGVRGHPHVLTEESVHEPRARAPRQCPASGSPSSRECEPDDDGQARLSAVVGCSLAREIAPLGMHRAVIGERAVIDRRAGRVVAGHGAVVAENIREEEHRTVWPSDTAAAGSGLRTCFLASHLRRALG